MSASFNDRKIAYIRKVVINRIGIRPRGEQEKAFAIDQIRKLAPDLVLGMPEGTAIWIFEEFDRITSSGMPPDMAIGILEAHRSAMLGDEEGPVPPSAVEGYAAYRLRKEHAHAELNQQELDYILKAARHWVDSGKKPKPAEAPIDWMLAPNMPAFTTKKPSMVLEWQQHLLLLICKVPTVAEATTGQKLPLIYDRVLTVSRLADNQARLLVTEESGLADSSFFCMFLPTGEHVNLGPARFSSDGAFLGVAILECQKALGFRGTPTLVEQRGGGIGGLFRKLFG